MKVGCQGGRAGVLSWYQLTDPTWNSSNWKVVIKLSNLFALGMPSGVTVMIIVTEVTLTNVTVYLDEQRIVKFITFIPGWLKALLDKGLEFNNEKY